MTELLLLRLFADQPMSGYDIQMILQQTQTERWAGIKVGSIYHALNRLEEKGKIEIANISKTGQRSKVTYKITTAGRIYFQELGYKTLSKVSIQYPTELYSIISVVDRLDKKIVITLLKEKQDTVRKEIKAISDGKKMKEEYYQGALPKVEEYTLSHMLQVAKQENILLKQLIQYLESEECYEN